MALDTVDAVRRCTLVAGVLVLIEEPSDARLFDDGDFDDAATPASIRVHQCHTDGIDAALTEGARLLAADGWRGPVAALPADLPFLRATDLEAVLRCASAASSVVADAEGSGTTLLTAPDARSLRPSYGPDSFRRHQRSGAIPVLVDPASSVRRDVDTLADLGSAADAGLLGIRTRRVLDLWSDDGSPQVTVLR